MKNKLLLIGVIFAFVLFGLLPTNVFATTHTLEEVAEKFNENSTVKQYKGYGYEISASVDDENENELAITIADSEENSSVVTFELDGSVLSNEKLTLSDLMFAMILIDSVGQVNGYEAGELNYTLNSEEIRNYTLEDEGIEVKENGDYYSLKLDIDKKIPLVDLTDFYLKPEDFDIIAKIIDDEDVGNQTGKKLKLAYNVKIGSDENEIYIAEDDELTESTYNSILSAIEVMYNEKVVEYFKEVYSEIETFSTILNGITIERDFYEEDEESLFYDKPRILVTFDNEYIKERFLGTEYIGETVDCGEKNITLDFTKDKSYTLSVFDSVKSSEQGILFNAVLEPVLEESGAQLEDDSIAYFDIKEGKIVASSKENSIFKMVIDSEEYTISLSATNPDAKKTTATAKHENAKLQVYKEDATYEDMYRYEEYDITVNVTYGKEEYKVLEGADQTVNVSKDEGLTFRINMEYVKFKESGKVYVDGKEVDSSKYTSKEGSTIITFTSEYTKSLSDGKHNLKVVVSDGEASATFTKETKPVDYRPNPDTGRMNIGFLRLSAAIEYLK